jgi:hypothetical protein
MVAGITAGLFMFPTGLSCRKIVWYVEFAIITTIIYNSAIVHTKRILYFVENDRYLSLVLYYTASARLHVRRMDG